MICLLCFAWWLIEECSALVSLDRSKMGAHVCIHVAAIARADSTASDMPVVETDGLILLPSVCILICLLPSLKLTNVGI